MRMMSRMIVASQVVNRTVRNRVAQNDGEMALDRRQHETCRDQCAQAEHHKHPRCSPVPSTVTQWGCSAQVYQVVVLALQTLIIKDSIALCESRHRTAGRA